MSFVLKRTFLVSLLLAGLALLIGWYDHRNTLRDTRERLMGEATLLAEHAARSLEGIDLTLRDLVRLIELRWRDGKPPDAGYHEMLRRRVGNLPQVTGMFIVDARGRMVADQISPKPPDSVVDQRAYFRAHAEAPEQRELFLGDPVRSPVSGKSFFTASYPVLDPNGEFGGVVAAVFDPFYYRRFYERITPRGEMHDVALVDGNGVIMASSTNFTAPIGMSVGQEATAAQSEISPDMPGGFVSVTLPETGEVHLAAMVSVPMFPFYAFVGLSQAEAFVGWHGLLAGLALAWLVATLGAGAAFHSIWKRERERLTAFKAMEKATLEASESLEKAEAASAAKSRFLAHMSHELRTPLNAILGFSEVIRDRLLGDEPPRVSEYAGLIHASGRHLLQIINDMLDLSRVEAGKMRLHPKLVPVTQLFESAGQLVSRDLSDGGVGLSTTISTNCPPLFADEKAAKQMLVNLLSNAAKFSAPGSRVTLSAAPCANGGVELSVADRGCGIPADQIETVFEPFGQASGDTAREGQGTGLGLPLVKSLIELHGGRITIDTKEGKGTRVALAFPPAPAPTLVHSPDSETPSRGNGGREPQAEKRASMQR